MGYYGRQDVGARTMRFDYMDRMDEDAHDQAAVNKHRADAYKQSLPPIEPDGTFQAEDGSEVSIYLNDKSRQIKERLIEASKIYRGEK